MSTEIGSNQAGFIVITLPQRRKNWRTGGEKAAHDGTAVISAIHIQPACCGLESEHRKILRFPLSRIEHNPILSELGFCRKCCPGLNGSTFDERDTGLTPAIVKHFVEAEALMAAVQFPGQSLSDSTRTGAQGGKC